MVISPGRAPSLRVQLRAEAVAVEAAVSVLCVSLLFFDQAVARAIGWAVVAGLVGVAGVQALRLVHDPGDEGGYVNLLGVGPETAATVEPGAEDPPTLFGNVLAAAAIPFIAVFVAVRIALLYVVPTVVVASSAALTSGVGLIEIAASWVVTVCIALANEYAVIRPLAKRHGISLD